MSQPHSASKFRHRRPWPFWLSITAVVLLAFLIIARLSMPYAIKWGAISWFESQQLRATVIDVDIFLLDGLFIIKGISAQDEAGKGFSLEQLDISWQWSPLRQRQVVIDKVGIGPLKLDVALFHNGDISLGGIILPANPEATEPVPPTADPGEPWDINLANLKLSDIEVCVDVFVSDQSLAQHACGGLTGLTWSGKFALMASEQTNTDNAPPIYLNGTLDLVSPNTCIRQFNATGELVLDYCTQLTSLVWSGDITLNPPHQTPANVSLPLTIKGSLDINGLNIHNNALDLTLLSLHSLALKDININTPNDISIASMQLQELSALQRQDQTSKVDAQVFAFDRFNLQSLKLVGLNDLFIDTIEMTETSAYLQRHKNGQLDYQAWLPVSKEADESGDPAASGPFNFVLGRFVFNSKQHFVYYDTSLKEPFKMDIHDIQLTLTDLSSKQPDKASHLALELMIDKHGIFKLDADLMPLAEKPTIKGSGQIAGFDLRLLAPMTKQYIGHNIKSGQLDTEIKIDVDKGVIGSNMALTLHQFELKTLDKDEAERLNSEFGFPLNSSLSLIRDRDNAIRLDIPVTGDIENPEFKPRDAIVKATSSAITAAVLHYYTPFGLVFAADALFDLATALSFEPVVFDAGTSELTGAHKEQLGNLATLMNDRPGIHLTLCGLSNREDTARLFPPSKQVQAGNNENKTVPAPMSPEQLASLQQLAESRSALVKNNLVKLHSVNASRLIECSPEYSQDGIPGVEISI